MVEQVYKGASNDDKAAADENSYDAKDSQDDTQAGLRVSVVTTIPHLTTPKTSVRSGKCMLRLHLGICSTFQSLIPSHNYHSS